MTAIEKLFMRVLSDATSSYLNMDIHGYIS
jgi:hypothetical protein